MGGAAMLQIKKLVVTLAVTIFISSYTVAKNQSRSAVTCFFNKGRLGNQLITYWNALLFSKAYNLPFLHKPISKNDTLFSPDQTGEYFDKKQQAQFSKTVLVKSPYNFPKALNRYDGTLYLIPCDENFETKLLTAHKINTRDYQQARLNFSQRFTPVVKVQDIFRPKNKITVAVHIRQGGDYDKTPLSQQLLCIKNTNRTIKQAKHPDIFYPLKFPPLQYYVDQIRNLWNMLGKKSLYIHVFTDDKNPNKLIAQLKKSLNGLPLTFAARLKGNKHNANVLDDLFAMAKFDCLI
jgi:hypothetical protein